MSAVGVACPAFVEIRGIIAASDVEAGVFFLHCILFIDVLVKKHNGMCITRQKQSPLALLRKRTVTPSGSVSICGQ